MFLAMRTLALVVLLLAVRRPVLAETVSTACRIVGVNAAEGNVTLIRQTGSGEKRGTSKVTGNAKITVGGKPATLDSLAVPAQARVTYDSDAKALVAIEVAAASRYRITLELSETGVAKYRAEKATGPREDDFPGVPLTLTRMPRAQVTKGNNGMFRLVHDFFDADPLEALYFSQMHATLDKASGSLVLTPGATPEAANTPKIGANFFYRNRLRLPIKVRCDLQELGDEAFTLSVRDPFRQVGIFQCKLYSEKGDLNAPFHFVAQWFDLDGKGAVSKVTDVYKVSTDSLSRPLDREFQLPQNAHFAVPVWLTLGRIGGRASTRVSRLEVQGRLVPMIGLSMKEADGQVVVEKALPGTIAERAGFRPGDRVLTINARQPSGLKQAMNAFAALPFGEEAVVLIRRGEVNQEIRVVVE